MTVDPIALGLWAGGSLALLWFSVRSVWRQVKLQALVVVLWNELPEWSRTRAPARVRDDVKACGRLNGAEVR